MQRRIFLGTLLIPFFPTAVAKHNRNKQYRLSLYHTHTEENINIVYRIGHEFQLGALKKLNYFLRDHRTNDVAVVDPKLFDLLHDLQRRAGGPTRAFEIISGYRSPKTNAMLRKASNGVAKRSLHMQGRAVDVRLRDIDTARLRDAAIGLRQGGVGYYGKSDFVHLDTGRVRRWGV